MSQPSKSLCAGIPIPGWEDAGGATAITNGFGGSRVRFSTNSEFPTAVTGTGTTLYGPLTITDADGYIGVGITAAAIFTGTDVRGPVTISTDSATAQRTTFGALTILMGGGDDHVNLSRTDVALATDIEMFPGQDTVNIDYQQTGTASAPLSRLSGPVTIAGNSPGPTFGTVETDLLEYAPGVTFGSLTTTSIIVIVG